MTHKFLALATLFALTSASFGQGNKGKDAVQKVEAVFEPAEAKPGQTVTLKVIVKLAEGYHTYPITQPAPEAKYSANSIVFPKDGSIVFVGETVDPLGPKTKKVEDYDLLVYPGGGTWERKAVVLPTAKAGPATSKVKFKMLVCDEDICFPPKTVDLEATLKILDSPPVPIDPKFKAEVEKAAKK